jgi:hypothetical protein
MGKTVYSRQKMDTVFVLVIFCVFAMSVLLVLTLGGSIYQKMSEKIEDGYDAQTGLSYIWSKVKNGDGSGGIRAREFGGVPALCIEEDYGGDIYVTMIYVYDGWLRELYGAEEVVFDAEFGMHPEDGLPVVESGALSFTQTPDGLIRAESDSGQMYLYPRAQRGLALRQ